GWIGMLNTYDRPQFYKGKFKDALPHGYGELIDGNGDSKIYSRIKGNFVNGKKEGTFTHYSAFYKDMKEPNQFEDFKDDVKIGQTRFASSGTNLTPSNSAKNTSNNGNGAQYININCSACYGIGTKTLFKTVTKTEYDSYTLIMPGDKNYGNWSGKTHY